MQNVGAGTSYFIIQTEVVFLRAYFLAFALPLLLPYINPLSLLKVCF